MPARATGLFVAAMPSPSPLHIGKRVEEAFLEREEGAGADEIAAVFGDAVRDAVGRKEFVDGGSAALVPDLIEPTLREGDMASDMGGSFLRRTGGMVTLVQLTALIPIRRRNGARTGERLTGNALPAVRSRLLRASCNRLRIATARAVLTQTTASMANFEIRLARPSDVPPLSRLREALWPESSAEEHAAELAQILAGNSHSILPITIFVAASRDGALLGFLEVGLRSRADGCDESHAVGYVEGWFVSENVRRRGIGAALFRVAEDWSRAQGCKEIASDTQIDDAVSLRAHQALGFQIAERAILFRKPL